MGPGNLDGNGGLKPAGIDPIGAAEKDDSDAYAGRAAGTSADEYVGGASADEYVGSIISDEYAGAAAADGAASRGVPSPGTGSKLSPSRG